MYRGEEDDEFSAFAMSKDGAAAYVSDNLGNVHVVDTRAPVRPSYPPLPPPISCLPSRPGLTGRCDAARPRMEGALGLKPPPTPSLANNCTEGDGTHRQWAGQLLET